MKQAKRIPIISPYLEPRVWQELDYAILKFFDAPEFDKFRSSIIFQHFSSTAKLINSDKIENGGVILMVYDQRLRRRTLDLWNDERRESNRLSNSDLKKGLEESSYEDTKPFWAGEMKGNLPPYAIPYIMYQGEIQKKGEEHLIGKLNREKKRIIERLNAPDFFQSLD